MHTLCSSLLEELGERQIHTIGVFATDWGADLLLGRANENGGNESWSVVDAAPWPALDAPGPHGPPWSPLTAIAAWWADRAEARYGPGAVHLRDCSEAAALAAQVDQPLLCSTLERSNGERHRTDLSGVAGEEPDVVLTVAAAGDHTWTVTSSTSCRRPRCR